MKFASKAILIKNNNYLLQLRDKKKNILYPNHWCFFGVRIKKNETPENCIIREMREELSIKVKVLMKIYECINYKTNTYLNYFFIDTNSIITRKNLAEGQNFGWFKKKKILNLRRTPDIRIFEDYLN